MIQAPKSYTDRLANEAKTKLILRLSSRGWTLRKVDRAAIERIIARVKSL